jgi:hypothetical protein
MRITYGCGHQDLALLVGLKGSARRDRIEWLEKAGKCSNCKANDRAAAIEKENTKSAAESVDRNLPELIGSEKQVAWANTLRLEAIAEIQSYIDRVNAATDDGTNLVNLGREFAAGTMSNLEAETSAKKFIDNRNENPFETFNPTGVARMEAAKKAINDAAKDIKVAANQPAIEQARAELVATERELIEYRQETKKEFEELQMAADSWTDEELDEWGEEVAANALKREEIIGHVYQLQQKITNIKNQIIDLAK